MSVKIIAEIAQGYEGKPEQALLLARAGTAARADAVKFQCVFADEIAVPSYRYHAFFRTLEMPLEVWQEIATTVRGGGAELILNVGGERSLDVAVAIGASAVKFHATSFFCDELIAAARKRFPMIYVSVGGLDVVEIEEFISRHDVRPGQVAFTYGFQASPTPLEKNNLRKLAALMSRFPGFAFGFEDHTASASPDRFLVPLVALGFGVQHLEKHLTLDPLLALEDSESALSAADFSQFVEMVRRCESTLGTGDLSLTDVELDYRTRVLKVTVAAADLPAGVILGAENTALRRVPDPGTAAVHRREELYGRRLRIPAVRHAPLTADMVEG